MQVAGPMGELHQFYIQPDKNGAQTRKEILAKAIKNILEADVAGANTQFLVRKSTGSVMVDRKVLCSVVIVDENTSKIAWFHPLREQLGIVQSTVEEQFAVVAGGPSSP